MALPQLEVEPVRLSEELHFQWHRPPLNIVEQQQQDPSTVRIFLNGCFDMMHVGHFNALRQAKRTFYQKGYRKVVLVAGIHSDAAITLQKGQPLMSDDERVPVLQATKWVDELVTALPYVSMSAALADALRVDWICHGDDLPVCKGGGGMYSDAIEKQRFQLLKRTEGISTTNILERLLRRDRQEGLAGAAASAAAAAAGGSGATAAGGSTSSSSSATPEPLESALATTQRLSQFAAPADPEQQQRQLGDAKRVVYVGGTFDLIHAGDVELLQQAAQLGDFLLVGLHSDETVRRHAGQLPVLTLLERALSVLSLRGVDDVVLGAPWEVNRELLVTMNIAVVVRGRAQVDPPHSEPADPKIGSAADDEQHRLPRELGILVEVPRTSALTSAAIAGRFAARRQQLAERNGVLWQKELSYLEGKVYEREA